MNSEHGSTSICSLVNFRSNKLPAGCFDPLVSQWNRFLSTISVPLEHVVSDLNVYLGSTGFLPAAR